MIKTTAQLTDLLDTFPNPNMNTQKHRGELKTRAVRIGRSLTRSPPVSTARQTDLTGPAGSKADVLPPFFLSSHVPCLPQVCLRVSPSALFTLTYPYMPRWRKKRRRSSHTYGICRRGRRAGRSITFIWESILMLRLLLTLHCKPCRHNRIMSSSKIYSCNAPVSQSRVRRESRPLVVVKSACCCCYCSSMRMQPNTKIPAAAQLSRHVASVLATAHCLPRRLDCLFVQRKRLHTHQQLVLPPHVFNVSENLKEHTVNALVLYVLLLRNLQPRFDFL